jgi:hypothetical protein
MQPLWLTLTFLVMAISPQLVAYAGRGSQILPVKESHIHVDDRQPYWLDNTQVLFTGFTVREAGPKNPIRTLNYGRYVWDIVRNTVIENFDRSIR